MSVIVIAVFNHKKGCLYMENDEKEFPMITVPTKVKRFCLCLFFVCLFLTLASIGIVIIIIKSFPNNTDITDVLWGSVIFIGFFIFLDLILLYFLFSYIIYYSSTVRIDNFGIKRVRDGIIKEQYAWKEIAAFYINSSPTHLGENWVILTTKLLDKPSKKMFRIRGYLGISLSSQIIMQLEYSNSIELELEHFVLKRKL